MSKTGQQIADGLAVQDNAGAVRFVKSKMFANIFAEGMELVEETAGYLDGEGRDLSRELVRSAALSYAAVSMRLTTRLMQIASWLLVLRALRESEMTYGEAALDKYRLGAPERRHDDEGSEEELARILPARLLELRHETHCLYERIARIDRDIFTDSKSPVSARDAASQIKALQEAFANG